MSASLLVVAAAVLGLEPAIDLESFRNIMDGLQADLKDVECVYEGDVMNLAKGTTAGPQRTFQGNFAFRADGSAHVDIYHWPADERHPLDREVLCLSQRSKFEQLRFQPDRGISSAKAKATHGGLLSLEGSDTPLRILPVFVLLEYLRDSGGLRTDNHMQYKFVGWDEVDGVKCASIRFGSETGGGATQGMERAYWVDMQRSGQVMRYELKYRGGTVFRMDDIKLREFRLQDNRRFWLPIRGKWSSFIGGRHRVADKSLALTDKATIIGHMNIVDNTVVINRDLQDGRFMITWSKHENHPAISAAKRVFENRAKQRPVIERKLRVRGMVDEANRQVHLLAASEPSRNGWQWSMIGSTISGVIGVGVLGGALVMRGRAR